MFSWRHDCPRFNPPQHFLVPREELAKLRADIGSLLLRHPSECMPAQRAPGISGTNERLAPNWRAAVRSSHEPLARSPHTLEGWTATGPLTTVGQTDADERREQTLAKDNERIAREQKEKDRRASNGRG